MNKSADKIHNLARAVIIDQGHILLCKTMDLDPPFYYLPGGHIDHQESACDALLRELIEEANAPAKIIQFLGVLEHRFTPGHSSICHDHEYNFYFQVESDALKYPNNPPRMESKIAMFWHSLSELAEIDLRPGPIGDLIQQWTLVDSTQKFQSYRHAGCS